MTIKRRLVFSYIGMVVIPSFLVGLTSGILRLAYATSDTGNDSSSSSASSTIFEYMSATEILQELNATLLSEPELFFDSRYMQNRESAMDLKGVLMVSQSGTVKYISSWAKKYPEVMDYLYTVLTDGTPEKRHFLDPSVLLRWEFEIPGQENGIIHYVRFPKHNYQENFAFAVLMMLFASFVLILTNGFLTFMVSRSIVSPLKDLERAAIKIRDGNLSGHIHYKVDDELGNVFDAFDEMRKRLKSSLETQATYEENRKELIASISHDLKTPLTVLKGYVEGLKDGVANTQEKQLFYLNTIQQKAEYLDRMIDDLSLFSKLELDNFPIETKKIDLKNFLEDIVAEFAFDYPEISFTTDFPGSESISVDPALLYRVFANIIQNSSIYAGVDNITVAMQYRLFDDKVVITIKDNGKGLDQEQLVKIFERFYRADFARNQNSGGSGLGLSIAAMIIKQHGGTINGESAPGQGLSIIISLPLQNKGSTI